MIGFLLIYLTNSKLFNAINTRFGTEYCFALFVTTSMIGIDKDGFLWKKVNGQWIRDEEVNIYPSPEFRNKRQYPDPILLEWKFERFVLKRNNVLARITYSLTSLFISSPTKARK